MNDLYVNEYDSLKLNSFQILHNYIHEQEKKFVVTFPGFKCQVTTDQLGTYLYFLPLRVTL